MGRTKLFAIIMVMLAIAGGLLCYREANRQEGADVRETEVKIGDIISFGENQWRVLDVQNGKALILSEKVIEKRMYHEKNEDITWERCTLRKYLNEEYLNSFSAEERSRIAETTIVNNDNPWFSTIGGNATKDKVFLLSLEEVIKYFGDSGQLNNKNPNSKYFINDQYNYVRIAKDAKGEECWWWLRSPGYYGNLAAYVHDFGRVHVDGSDVHFGAGGVRPALWLNL